MFLSKSMLMDYLKCPYQFYEKAILGIREPASRAMTQGSEVHKVIEDFWSHASEEHFPEIDVKSISDSKVRKCAKNFLEFQKERHAYLQSINRLDLFVPEIVEKKIVNEDLEIKGIIDAVDKNADGTHNIIEVKSYSKERTGIEDHMAFEIAFYKYLLKESLGIDAKYGVLYMPVFGKFIKYEIKDDDVEWVKTIIKDVRKKVLDNHFEHAPFCDCQ